MSIDFYNYFLSQLDRLTKENHKIILSYFGIIQPDFIHQLIESLESYLKRLTRLEEIAESFEGVDKSFAIQAGREVRIMVKPDRVDDITSVGLARDIVKKIEAELEYPGQIRVTVIRETRAVDYAK